ncbi:MAG TPA: MBL fold metallo-hydrolase [Myxococcales bacterium]|jgi:L-ascorbate metabolism protein UlaG (beta-lactamase superfamily)|nr:MBL fold metallo-hydrolase [Myxococcales bacterium]
MASTSRKRRVVLVAVGVVALGAVIMAGATSSWFASFGGILEGTRLQRALRSPRFRDGRFVNPVPTEKLEPGTFWQMVRHQLLGNEERVPKRAVPVAVRSAADYAQLPASGLRATWIGHASALIEIDGRRVLTDPIWSERCSPSTLVGPRRFHPPPLALADLPPIDAVVISHDHYDHLDMATVTALAARGAYFVVPLGVGAHLERWGIPTGRISELDWGESTRIGVLLITATPARHYSGRNPLRGDRMLWSSWVVRGPRHRFFFSGDSGYFDGFKQIAAQHGPFDLTLIKIGACDPTWQQIHMSPAEAVQAHLDLGGKVLLPVHWGTFNLAFHAWNAPPEEALAAARELGATIVLPRPGELVEPDRPQPVDPWWR